MGTKIDKERKQEAKILKFVWDFNQSWSFMRMIKSTILVLVLFTLGASALQYSNHLVKETPLKGYFQLREAPYLKLFTWRKWFSSAFQDDYASRLNDNIGFRNSLIRVNNQCDYTLLGLIHAQGFIRGQQQYLFEEDYIHEYTGEYFIGKTVIDKKLARLKNVMDSLKAHHVPLLLVYEPGKAGFYPEYIPGRFHPEKGSQTNYDYMTRRSQELGLEFMDMHSYFLKMKDTARYPLFPKYGMHWSLYGVPFAVDTLVKSIERLTGTGVPGFKTQKLIPSETPVGTDNDIGQLLNLIFPLSPAPAVYPSVSFEKTPAKKLSVLVIADSYYDNIADDYSNHLFARQDFWYYNKKVYPYHNQTPPVLVDKSNLREKLINYHVILLMASEINLHCGFWNFADEAFLAFHPEIKDPLIYNIENEIRNDRDWFRFMVNKARLQGKPLEEMVKEDAGYTFNSNYSNLQGKSYWDTIYHITFDIKNNAEWLAQVEKNAKDRNIALDSMLLLDAIYSYGQSKKNH